jgi:cellulose synthase/poly-beta-1,6-N-acetylglucosamine synthase-like glycosyltransferase
LVSIIIAAHNEGDYVRRTIESILANTDDADFEIILIDDGCTDAGFAFLDREPYRSDRRLHPYRFEKSVGCIRARHQGVLLARGDLIAFLDAHLSVLPGWLTSLSNSVAKLGGNVAVTPDISPLVESTWLPSAPSGQVVAVDEKLDFVWLENQAVSTELLPTVLGCCVLMPRKFYDRIGGFDLGLRRWGCEFIDLTLKVYAAGGRCCYEPAVLVGHLFRDAFPYSMNHRDLNYNKLRTGYVHFPDESFRQLAIRLATAPDIVEATLDFRAHQPELDQIRHRQQTVNCRDPKWFVRTFLPGLCQ